MFRNYIFITFNKNVTKTFLEKFLLAGKQLKLEYILHILMY